MVLVFSRDFLTITNPEYHQTYSLTRSSTTHYLVLTFVQEMLQDEKILKKKTASLH